MKRSAVILLILFAGIHQAWATHYRAGVLTYRLLSRNNYEVTVYTYTTNIYGNGTPDRDTVAVDWGDGVITPAPRVNGNIGPTGVPMGVSIGNGIKVNIYVTSHQYNGPEPFYVISMKDPNRMAGIWNINGGNATDNVQFYISDTLKVLQPALSGLDNSPIMLNAPIDFGNVNDTFRHNPDAFDPDGDSLSFELVPSLQDSGVVVPNYVFPDGVNPGINNKISINPITGEVVWATPQKKGPYNVAILIREYRNGLEIGSVLYDMMIIVLDEINHPPHIFAIRDTCVVAGTDLQLLVTANDPDSGQTVTLSANGGPFQDADINPKASFLQSTGVDTAYGTFDWQTNCNEIREQFYQVVFKAQDDYNNPSPLTDLVTWIIKIIGPGPENLAASAVNNVIDLTWQSPYACDGSQTSHFIGFSVWRREGPNPFTPDTCNPGLAGHGYTRIKDLTTAYSYTDSNVIIGKDYCYRIQAEFALTTTLGIRYNQVPSLPSNEACAHLKIDRPVITKVSISNTDGTNGTDTIAWQKPPADPAFFDTIIHPGPYQFVLYRAEGLTGTTNRTQVVTFTSPYFASFADTFYYDSGLNTSGMPYNYQVELHSNNTNLGSASAASSIFLSVRRNNQRLDLSWVDSVPWENQQYILYRLNAGTGNYDSIASVDTTVYSDTALINDSSYCYYVEGIGQYTIGGLHTPLINLSQRVCQRPHDTIPPCPPVLMVTNPCTGNDSSCSVGPDQLRNSLTWTRPPDSCGRSDTRKYNIYFADPVSKKFVLVDSTLSLLDTTFQHAYINSSNSVSLAGCYAVTAIDTVGNESVFSNSVCVDNCPCYLLPNVFTPNADGHNDYFVPIQWRFITKVDMKIFNRWGDLVYETSDPNINWNGNDTKSGKPLAEDVYYYVCKLYEIRETGIVENKNKLSGFIHLIRGNGGSDK